MTNDGLDLVFETNRYILNNKKYLRQRIQMFQYTHRLLSDAISFRTFYFFKYNIN